LTIVDLNSDGSALIYVTMDNEVENNVNCPMTNRIIINGRIENQIKVDGSFGIPLLDQEIRNRTFIQNDPIEGDNKFQYTNSNGQVKTTENPYQSIISKDGTMVNHFEGLRLPFKTDNLGTINVTQNFDGSCTQLNQSATPVTLSVPSFADANSGSLAVNLNDNGVYNSSTISVNNPNGSNQISSLNGASSSQIVSTTVPVASGSNITITTPLQNPTDNYMLNGNLQYTVTP
jgi:hypothetical protein